MSKLISLRIPTTKSGQIIYMVTQYLKFSDNNLPNRSYFYYYSYYYWYYYKTLFSNKKHVYFEREAFDGVAIIGEIIAKGKLTEQQCLLFMKTASSAHKNVKDWPETNSGFYSPRTKTAIRLFRQCFQTDLQTLRMTWQSII